MAAGLAERLSAAELTYREAGQTAGRLPPGYHHLRRSVAAGSGDGTFEDATRALFGWQVHLRAGLRVTAPAATVQPGGVVLLGVGAGPLRVSAPCRVVYMVDEPHRRGFAYGTLPGHPESGEEAFVIEQHKDGTVAFAITAFSTAATLLARAAGPAGRAIQGIDTARYLRALAEPALSGPRRVSRAARELQGASMQAAGHRDHPSHAGGPLNDQVGSPANAVQVFGFITARPTGTRSHDHWRARPGRLALFLSLPLQRCDSELVQRWLAGREVMPPSSGFGALARVPPSGGLLR
jgi:uncharacterized protein (UPF0548 family)